MANSNSAGPSNQDRRDDDGLDQAASNSDNNRNFVNGTASIDMFKVFTVNFKNKNIKNYFFRKFAASM